jgi:hypothetical protein
VESEACQGFLPDPAQVHSVSSVIRRHGNITLQTSIFAAFLHSSQAAAILFLMIKDVMDDNAINAMDDDNKTDIRTSSASCANRFADLLKYLRGSRHTEHMTAEQIDNENARFKIWAGNLGALQRGPSSLDVRLRGSIIMKAAILRLLKSLRESLDASKCFASCHFIQYVHLAHVFTRNVFTPMYSHQCFNPIQFDTAPGSKTN